MKSIYTNPNVEIVKLHAEDILSSSTNKPPSVPDIGVEDEGEF